MGRAKVISLSADEPISPQRVSRVAGKLASGGVVMLPTDTIYGFSASVRATAGIKRIREIKGWETNRPFLLLAPSLGFVLESGCRSDRNLVSVMRKFWPGKVTFILWGGEGLPAHLHSADDKVAVRVPESDFLLAVLEELQEFVVSTSANKSDQPPINDPEMLKDAFGKEVDLIVDMGSMEMRSASTLVDITTPEPTLIRQGAFPFGLIETYIHGGGR